jgi:alpha-glucosidase
MLRPAFYPLLQFLGGGRAAASLQQFPSEKPMRPRSGLVRTLSIFPLFLLSGHSLGAQPAVTPPGDHAFTRVSSIEPLPNGIVVRDDTLTMRITALRDDVLRIRATSNATLPEDSSWAVLPEARTASVAVMQDSDSTVAGFHTASLRIALDRATGRMTLSDLAGNVLQQDVEPMHFTGESFSFAKAMPADEHYFGLGDKTGSFDHRDQAFRMWNTDAYGWQESTDPLYKDIPFYLSYRAGTALGVLVDNTWPCSFDFGRTRRDTFEYRTEAGPADIYLVYGPSAKHVLEGYAWLTGPTPLPPLWALGFQQSRYSYMSQARVLEVADRLRNDHIPADAIYLDIDYQQKNRPFTINREAFPDMPELIASLHHEKLHVIAITDLHIANIPGWHYAPFDSGIAGDHFVKNEDGSIFVGKVWPGPSVFPDFTRQQTRRWWGGLYKDFTQMGIDGFWNDMNEPSVFNSVKTMPDNAVHRIEEPGFATRTATHREIHNLYGMENSRATYDGQLNLKPDTRPFVLTRASYAGGQRYAATWTGDNSATWDHLRLTTSMLKNLGLSGFSLAGADVGGYAGTPSAELLTKWIEIAAFQPIDRDHAEKGTGDHEVWANGPEQEDIRRHFIEERYKLLPYLYTVMEEGTRTGLPLLRPLFLEFPDAAPDRHPMDVDLATSGEFMVGPDLLVAAPPFLEKLDDYDAKLPSTGWYDFWSGRRVKEVPTVPAAGALLPDMAGVTPAVHIHPELATLPVFVRPGAILPIEPLVQSTAERPVGPLTLRVFPGPRCEGHLYQDDGSTFSYKEGDFLRMAFSCEESPNHDSLTIHIGKHEGFYPAWWQQIEVQVNGLSRNPASVRVDGRAATFGTTGQSITITTSDQGNGIDVVILL